MRKFQLVGREILRIGQLVTNGQSPTTDSIHAIQIAYSFRLIGELCAIARNCGSCPCPQKLAGSADKLTRIQNCRLRSVGTPRRPTSWRPPPGGCVAYETKPVVLRRQPDRIEEVLKSPDLSADRDRDP